MALRTFATPQRAPTTRVRGRRILQWLELRCPQCRQITYIENRKQRLARTGSAREYTLCAYCFLPLTLGRLVTYPRGILARLAFWRRLRGGATVKAAS